jgi:nucleoid-associated protein YgaU
MSTLEKLLVLGVLILVGVILAISLFWNRPDAGGGALDNETSLVVNSGQQPDGARRGDVDNTGGLPNQSSLTPAGGVQLDGELAPALSVVQPADAANLAPYPFLQPSLNPEYWSYRVRQGDTPMIVSERVSGTRDFARVISRSNEDRPLVPGTSILVPREIVKAPSSVETGIAAGGPAESGATEPKGVGNLVTGPPPAVKPTSGEVNDTKAAGAANPAASPAAAATNLYIVKRGDSLRKIAREQLKSEKRWKDIKTVNNLKSDSIREGQKLILP